MTINLVPGEVRLADLEKIYRSNDAAMLTPDCHDAINASAAILSKAAKGSDPVYGVNTGFGKLANTRIAPDDVETLQRNLILSHCAGVGDPLSPEIVRLIIALKLISLGTRCLGRSDGDHSTAGTIARAQRHSGNSSARIGWRVR